jgi:hypothetical protein
MLIQINTTDKATILAALRFYQENGQGDPDNRSDAIHGIATGGSDDDVTSLDAEGIDELCERINCATAPTVHVVAQFCDWNMSARVFATKEAAEAHQIAVWHDELSEAGVPAEELKAAKTFGAILELGDSFGANDGLMTSLEACTLED